jgi:molecular chaperone DnaK
MGYRLGIDLGTTNTVAAVSVDNGPTQLLTLGAQTPEIPSLVFLNDQGEIVAGDVAAELGAADPSLMIPDPRRHLGADAPLMIAGHQVKPEDATAALLRFVVDRAVAAHGTDLAETVLTYPAQWNEYQLDCFGQAIQTARLAPIRLCTEAEAAAASYAAPDSVQDGGRVALFDLGGGACSVTVLTKTPTGFEVSGVGERADHPCGADFDQAVLRLVLGGLGAKGKELERPDADSSLRLEALRRTCVKAKEALSVQTEVAITATGVSEPVRLTRTEFESLVRPALRESLGLTTRALSGAGVASGSLAAVLGVGGCCRMPIVRTVLEQQLKVPVAIGHHPEHDLVIGSLLVGQPAQGAPKPMAATSSESAAAIVAAAPPVETPAKPLAPEPAPSGVNLSPPGAEELASRAEPSKETSAVATVPDVEDTTAESGPVDPPVHVDPVPRRAIEQADAPPEPDDDEPTEPIPVVPPGPGPAAVPFRPETVSSPVAAAVGASIPAAAGEHDSPRSFSSQEWSTSVATFAPRTEAPMAAASPSPSEQRFSSHSGQQSPNPPGEYPPGQYPPGQFPPGEYPPGHYPPGPYPPGQRPPEGPNEAGRGSGPPGAPPPTQPSGAGGSGGPGGYPPAPGEQDSGSSGSVGRMILIVAAIVVAIGAVVAVALVLFRSGQPFGTTGSPAGPPPVTSAPPPTASQNGSQSASPDSTPGDSSTPGAPTLPAATPIPNTVVVVPMKLEEGPDRPLYLVDTEGNNEPEELPALSGANANPMMQRSRTSIIYLNAGKLRVMASDGSGDRRLLKRDPAGCDRVAHASWSQADPNVMLISCRISSSKYTLLVTSMEGRLIRRLDTEDKVIGDFGISPDGQTVVYWATDEPGEDGGALFTLPIIGTGSPKELTDSGPGVDADPAWSPDGTQIAFRRTVDGNQDVYVMNADGSGERVIADTPADDFKPCWSPDGKSLLIISNRRSAAGAAGTTYDLWLTRLSDKEASPLNLDAESITRPFWVER